MNVIELTRREGKAVLAYLCGECQTPFSERVLAEGGCRCMTCGKTLQPGPGRRVGSEHFDCMAARIAKREQEEREAHQSLDKIPDMLPGVVGGDRVKRVLEKDYSGPVFLAGYRNVDSFHADIQALRDAFARDGRSLPLWVYGCSVTNLVIYASDVIGQAVQDLTQDSQTLVSTSDANELQALLDAWTSKIQVPDTWNPDLTLVVLLTEGGT